MPGVLGIGALLAAGLRLEDCYLRVASASKGELAVLTAVFLLLIAILPAGRWVGWSTLGVLLYAPLTD